MLEEFLLPRGNIIFMETDFRTHYKVFIAKELDCLEPFQQKIVSQVEP